MDIDKAKCVAFTGHRSCKLKDLSVNLFTSGSTLEEMLEIEITKAIDCGYTTFLRDRKSVV